MNPYQSALTELKDKDDVILHRADAPDLVGTIKNVDDQGCLLEMAPQTGTVARVFVAHRDIRGVASIGWDYSQIG